MKTLSKSALYRIAREARPEVNQWWAEYVADCGLDESDQALYDHELYLYVYNSGAWLLEHAQYLTDHCGIVAAAPIGYYPTIEALYNELEWAID